MSNQPVKKYLLQSQTAGHYDNNPFDFMTAEDEARIEELQPRPFLRFVESYINQDDKVAEVGCGPGRATLYLEHKAHDVFAIDLSMETLLLARKRAATAQYARATNLVLPFANKSFDIVISDGVIHHTPDPKRAFEENAGILKNKGYIYVAVYNRLGYYYYVYNWLGKPVRWLNKTRPGKLLVHSTLLPVYYFVHLLKTRGKRTWYGARNFFYDYIITPQATFHTRDEIVEWGKGMSLELIDYDPDVGNVHAFYFMKK